MSSGIAIVFPGQGSQRQGMLDLLPAGGESLLDRACERSGLDLRRIAASGSREELADTRAAQPLLYVADVSWGLALRDAGLKPLGVAGHSLGELAALAVAGVYEPMAGVDLVVARSRAMAECAADTPGGMVAVIGLDGPDVAAVIAPVEGVWMANDNCPGQVVISGTHDGLGAATAALEDAGARRLVMLDVAGPFHSPLMEPAANEFGEVLDETPFGDAEIPVWQNADPDPETAADAMRERLRSQITSPVRWTETMRSLAEAGAEMLVEAGPGTVLKGLARRVEPLRAVSTDESGLTGTLEEVAGS